MAKIVLKILLLFCVLPVVSQNYILTYQGNRVVASGSGISGNIAVVPGDGGTSPTFENNYCLELNGTDEYASLTGSLLTGTTAMVSFWVYPETGTRTIFGEDDCTDDYFIRLHSTNYIMIRTPSNYTYQASTFTLNQWTHVVLSYNYPYVDIFVNNTYKATKTLTTEESFQFDRIGSASNGTEYYDGKIDEVACWNTAPPAYSGDVPEQVTELFGDGSVSGSGDPGGVFTSNRVDYWPFEQSLSGVWNNNDLTGTGITISNYINN